MTRSVEQIRVGIGKYTPHVAPKPVLPELSAGQRDEIIYHMKQRGNAGEVADMMGLTRDQVRKVYFAHCQRPAVIGGAP